MHLTHLTPVVIYFCVADEQPAATTLSQLTRYAIASDLLVVANHHDIPGSGPLGQRPGWAQAARVLLHGGAERILCPGEDHLADSPSQKEQLHAWLRQHQVSLSFYRPRALRTARAVHNGPPQTRGPRQPEHASTRRHPRGPTSNSARPMPCA
ncbi:hypothetical protein GCM10009578_065760 [Streptomyces rhizosphaericus]